MVAVVSADALTDSKNGQSNYSLQVEVPVQELRKLSGRLQLFCHYVAPKVRWHVARPTRIVASCHRIA